MNVSKTWKHYKSEFQERALRKDGQSKDSKEGHKPNAVEYFDVRNNFDALVNCV